MLTDYKEFFPDIVQDLRIIGDTTNNLPIYAICFYKKPSGSLSSNLNSDKTLANNSSDIKKAQNFSNNFTENRQKIEVDIKDRSTFLITSGFRGSDYIATSMALFMIKYLIFQNIHNDSVVNYLLENRVIWIVPLLNADSYDYIAQKYLKSLTLNDIKKNRRVLNCQEYFIQLFYFTIC